MYPPSIQNLIKYFAKLPSIGPKSAERLVFHLLYRPKSELGQFAEALKTASEHTKVCSKCNNFSEGDPCHICSDPRRSSKIICVVEKPQDVIAIEKIGSYPGFYHILGGNINPLENQTPDQLKINELVERIKNEQPEEIILALNPNMEGETTSLYISKVLKQFPNIKISKPARGLPMGADLEYADEITLENAFKNRNQCA